MARPDKEIPFCTIFLVVGAIICHTMVFAGNLATAKAMKTLGESTKGWSNVGMGMGESMANELDDLMDKTATILSDSINRVQKFQTGLDTAMDLAGNIADGILDVVAPGNNATVAVLQESKQTVLLQTENKASLLQMDRTKLTGGQKSLGRVHVMPFRRYGNATASNTMKNSAQSIVDNIVLNVTTQLGYPVNISGPGGKHIPARLMPTPAQIRPILSQQVHIVIGHIIGQITPMLKQFFNLVEPALLQVGKWLVSFGDKIKAVVETFSTSLDKVQAIFNQLMEQFSQNAGAGEDQMLYDTFTLFDASNTGFISAQDLKDVAKMYSIVAMQGAKADDLFQRYDVNHDGRIFPNEFKMLVHDEDIPGAMAMVLRTYAKRMAEISGQIKSARLRDEVASAVVDYFTLVCSKNMTKVGWVSQALTNKSVTMEFSADILKQLASNDDNPNQLTTADVGAIVVNEMSRLNAPYVAQIVDLMNNPSFWVSEGFNLDDQAPYVERVVRWVTQANNGMQVLANIPAYAPYTKNPKNISGTLPPIAKNLTQMAVNAYKNTHPGAGGAYNTTCSQDLLTALLGGVSASDANNDPKQKQAANAGVPAKPSTLLFAARLASNSSATAKTFQAQAMAYSGKASDALDNFANQIQGMLQKVTSFLTNMQDYSTPTGITRLEKMVLDFVNTSANDVASTVVTCVDRELTARLPGQLVGLPPMAVNAISGVFTTLQTIMTSFQTILPAVVDDLKFARKQVSAVSKVLHNTFDTFHDQGPPIFDTISELYSTLWTAYFWLFAILTSMVLFYGFWASGWFGGPASTVVEAYEPPQTFRDRCRVCCASCGACMRACHDSHFCFWSIALLMEIIVLVLFIVSIVLCLLAGIKAFMSAGCAQVYILNDGAICTGTIGTLRQWLSTFLTPMGIPLGGICDAQQLRTCHLIGAKLKTSAMLTVIGSLAAAVLSFQMIIESAIMHERARWRRMFDEETKKV